MLAAVYRVVYQQRFGLPATLGTMLAQEGLAGVFAGATPELPIEALAAARQVVGAAGEAPDYPTAFVCMYGDEAGEQLGYRPLGLPPRAGFDLALADALNQRLDPVSMVALRN
jgi:hypothetical protein